MWFIFLILCLWLCVIVFPQSFYSKIAAVFMFIAIIGMSLGIAQFCADMYRDVFDFKCVSSYSDGVKHGTIYKINISNMHYVKLNKDAYCYTSEKAPDFSLVGFYDRMIFCYAKDSAIVLCTKKGRKFEWFNLQGEKIMSNYYTGVSKDQYDKLYAKKSNFYYDSKHKTIYDNSISFPEEISSERLPAYNALESTYRFTISSMDSNLVSAWGYATMRERNFAFWSGIMACIITFIGILCNKTKYGGEDYHGFSFFLCVLATILLAVYNWSIIFS